MFNNKRYKYSQNEEEQDAVLSEEEQFKHYIDNLVYYRFFDRNDQEALSFAKILFPYYLQDSSHWNLSHIGHAIANRPENNSDTSFYELIAQFDLKDLRDELILHGIKQIFPFVSSNKIDISSLDHGCKLRLLTRANGYFTEEKYPVINQLISLPHEVFMAITGQNPRMIELLVNFYSLFPEYIIEICKNYNLSASFIQLFIENPNLLKNIKTLVFLSNNNSVPTFNQYFKKWGENLDISDLSDEEKLTFASSLITNDTNAYEISPEEIKKVIKNPPYFNIIKNFSNEPTEFLSTLYNIKKLVGDSEELFIEKLLDAKSQLDPNLSPNLTKIKEKSLLLSTVIEFFPFKFDVSSRNNIYDTSFALRMLAGIPQESLKTIGENNREGGLLPYLDSKHNKNLTSFEKKYIGKIPYRILKDFNSDEVNDQIILDKIKSEIRYPQYFGENSDALQQDKNILRRIDESGLPISDPKIIEFAFYNSCKYAHLSVEDYFTAFDKLKIIYPNKNQTQWGDLTTHIRVFPSLIAVFGKDIPENIKEIFDQDSIVLEFGSFERVIQATRSEVLLAIRNFINRNSDKINSWEINRIISKALKINSLANTSLFINDEIIDISPQRLIFILDQNFLDFNADTYFNTISNIYRHIDINSELFSKMNLLMSKDNRCIGSSPKAFEFIFDKLPNYTDESLSNAAKIIAMFNKKSELWLKKNNNLHDAAQVIPTHITDKVKTKGADFALRSNLSFDKLSTILEGFDKVTDEDLLLPENEIYNKVFLASIKENAQNLEVRSDDFLLEFSSHGFKADSFQIDDSRDYHDYYDYEDEEDEENNSSIIKYTNLENVYLQAQSVALPEWARNSKFTSTYNNKQLEGYFLPRSDTRGMFLGKYTGCCQHPGAEAWTSAIAGQISDYACFFVVENPKNKEIVCQSFTWENLGYDQYGSQSPDLVVFDNVEAINIGTRMDAVVDIYNQAAKHIATFGKTVILGNGASDIDLDKFPTDYMGVSPDPNTLKEDFEHIIYLNEDIYTDAENSKLLAEPEESEESNEP